MNYAVLILKRSLDQQKFAARDKQAIPVVKIRRHDHICDARLILHGKKDESFRGSRTLARDYATRSPHKLSIFAGSQFFGR